MEGKYVFVTYRALVVLLGVALVASLPSAVKADTTAYQFVNMSASISSNGRSYPAAYSEDELSILNFNPANPYSFNDVGLLFGLSYAGNSYDHVTGEMRAKIYSTPDGTTVGSPLFVGNWIDISVVDTSNPYAEMWNGTTDAPDEGFVHFTFPTPASLATTSSYLLALEQKNVEFSSTYGSPNQNNFARNVFYSNSSYYNNSENRTIINGGSLTSLPMFIKLISSSSTPSFYAPIKNTTSGYLNLYDDHDLSANVLKRLPEDWIVKVASTTD